MKQLIMKKVAMKRFGPQRIVATLMVACALLVGVAAGAFAAPVNINKAGAEEIAVALKGIGIKKAQDVVAFREKHGPFKSVEQLRDVKGFGAKTIEKNRQDIRLQ